MWKEDIKIIETDSSNTSSKICSASLMYVGNSLWFGIKTLYTNQPSNATTLVSIDGKTFTWLIYYIYELLSWRRLSNKYAMFVASIHNKKMLSVTVTTVSLYI